MRYSEIKKLGINSLYAVMLAVYRFLVFIPIRLQISQSLESNLECNIRIRLFCYASLRSSRSICFYCDRISPYITASIIMQLLGVIVPAVEELTEQGEV